MEEDWGLEAIVRGCTHDNYTINNSPIDYYSDDILYNCHEVEKNHDNSFSHVNELDDFYKPFYDSMVPSFSPLSVSDHHPSNSLGDQESVKLEQQEDVKVELDHPKETLVIATPSAKYKRKNQLKRVVVKVTAEGVSSDKWAWRKYGQKPIKGSPYPRSYYRCSSSKGCLARKQVEQSCSDQDMYILTYTAEHNHKQPTRRSSLAGTNRQNFTSMKTTSSR